MKIAGAPVARPIVEALFQCRAHFLGAVGFSLFTNILLLAPSLYMLQVYDRAIPTGGRATLLYLTIVLAIALIALVGLDALRGRLLVRAGIQLENALSRQVLKHMLSEGEANKAQLMRDLDSAKQVLVGSAATTLLDLPFIPIFILVSFLLNVWLGVLAVCSLAVLVSIAIWNQRAIRPLSSVASQRIALSHISEQGSVQQAGMVRALGMVGAVVERQRDRRLEGITASSSAQFAGTRFTALSRFVRQFVQSAALGLGALLAIVGDISSGAIIAGSILIGRALQPVDGLTANWGALTSAHGAFGRLSAALASSQTPRDWTSLPSPSGDLGLEDIRVATPDGRQILVGVSLRVVPGEVVGIIGRSGSGKTTLAKVAAGALVAGSGIVRIDGANRSDWEPDLLGKFIGYLPQEPSLLQGSITDNISRFETFLATPRSLVDERVIAAAKLAGVHDLILKLPKGYDYEIGPTGMGLSSGQAQRIALARALYDNPVILILDEPNAFLDAEGEAALLNAIATMRSRGAATLLIAHRRSVLQQADRLIVLENGQVSLSGSTEEVAAQLSGRPAEAVS